MAFHMEGSTEVAYIVLGFVYSLFAQQQHTIISLTDQVGNNVFGTPAPGCECGQVCVFVLLTHTSLLISVYTGTHTVIGVRNLKLQLWLWWCHTTC